jgi:hypothetical protein
MNGWWLCLSFRFHQHRVRKGLCLLFGTTDILLEVANSLDGKSEPDQLTYTSGKYSLRKP